MVFVAPIEYDHYGEANSEQTFLDAKQKVLDINPNASFIRSDVQDQSELYAYLYKSKRIWEEVTCPDSFRPKVVSSDFLTSVVVDQLATGQKGADVVVRGEKERHLNEVAHNKDIEEGEMSHHLDNIRQMVSKYKGPEDRFGNVQTSKFL